MPKRVIVAILMTGTALAQRSVSGVAVDSRAGTPIANAIVTALPARNNTTRPLQTTTDAQGRYILRDLPAGQFTIALRTADTFASRLVTLDANDLAGIDFQIANRAAIRGKVVDESKAPVAGALVQLVAREYQGGQLRTLIKAATRANDKGEYTLPGIEPGRAWHLLAEKRLPLTEPVSTVPRDPKLRKRVLAPTYYPNSPDVESAAPLTLNPGEQRDAIDIQLRRTPGLCIEATLDSAGAPAALLFWLQAEQPGSGEGAFLPPPGGMSGPDGKVRVCNLPPGSYRLTALHMLQQGGKEVLYGSSPVTLEKTDVTRLRVSALGGSPIKGEVAWAADGPATLDSQLTLGLVPLTRAPLQGEKRDGARAPIPGAFTVNGVLRDDYLVRTSVTGPGLYVKDILFAGASILEKPLRLGLAPDGAALRIVVGRDGGTLQARVTAPDGKPIGNARIVAIPASASSEAELSRTLVSGVTDQDGNYFSPTLPPSRYFLLALQGDVDSSPETLAKLLRSRTSRAQVVEIPPGAGAQMKLALSTLD